MEPELIGMVEVGGRQVFYRREQVIAIGNAAIEFVAAEPSAVQNGESIDLNRRDGTVAVVFGGVDSEALVSRARARGLRVQFNHVLFAHCGCGCDPCCGGSGGAHPYKSNSVTRAHPYKSNAGTSAETVDLDDVAGRSLSSDVNSLDDSPNAAHVWVLDTGLAPPDGLDRDGDGKVDVAAGHGTFIDGVIRQLGPLSKIEARVVIDRDGHVLDSMMLPVLTEVVEESGPNTIVNLSFGGDFDDPNGALLADKVREIQERGGVVVASAGNDASCRPTYPAALPGVASVGAADKHGDPAEFTNYGSWVRTHALGVDIASTFLQGSGNGPHDDINRFTSGWAKWSGTSFAAPVVTAAIALKINGGLTATQALGELLDEGAEVPCLGIGVAPDGVLDLVHG